MAKLFGVIPYGRSGGALGEFIKDAGTVGEGFMGRALATKDAEDAREADIVDTITKATLTAAVNLDSKYPAFVDYQEEKLNKYKSLANNSAVGPEVAKWAYSQPGFLDEKTWLEDAIAWSLNPQNATFKYSGNVEPEEQFQKNIDKFQNRVRSKFGDTHGDNMSNLFVGAKSSTSQLSPTSTTDSTQTGTTDTTANLTGSTQTDTGAEGDFTTSMMPPLDTSQTTAEIKASVWKKVLGGYENGLSPRDMLKAGFINEGELNIWDNTTGRDKLKADAITTAMKIDDDYQAALNSGNSEALIQATANLQNKVNMLYNLNRTLALEDDKNIPNVELNNKTYKPSKNENDKIMETFPEDGDGKIGKVIYSEGDGDDVKFYVKEGNVMLEIIPDEASKNSGGKGYAIEGSPRYKELKPSKFTISPIRYAVDKILN